MGRDLSPRDTLTRHGIFRYPADYHPCAIHTEESVEPFYQRVVAGIKLVLRAQGVTVTIRGSENIPETGGALIALNHTSYLDFIFGGVAAYLQGRRLVRFMAKKEIFHLPVVGTAMRKMHHISVDRGQGRASFNEAVDRLSAGQLVGIFPESTISRSLTIKPVIKTGAVRIAHTAGVPLIPAVMVGAQRMWTKDHTKNLGRSSTPVLIHIGSPLTLTGDPDADTEELRITLVEMLDKAWDDYDRLNGPLPDHAFWVPASRGGAAPTPQEAEALDAKERKARDLAKKRKADSTIERKAKLALDVINPARRTFVGGLRRGLARLSLTFKKR